MANETYSATSGSGARAGIWAPIVTINGVDQTARIVGEIRIDAEEGAARVADLTIRPPAGTVFSIAGWVPGWVGKSITIQIADVSSGSSADLRTLFSGVIDTPSLDLDLRVRAALFGQLPKRRRGDERSGDRCRDARRLSLAGRL